MIATPVDATLSNRLKAQAYGIGFDLAGIAKLGPAETAGAFESWIAKGYAGEMAYLPKGADKRRDTRLAFSGAVSALVVALDYGGSSEPGPVARYARGDDYHELMWGKLDSLREWLESETGGPVAGKSYVDTGPILERDLARRAGLGWFGKNTNLLNPERGSFFFIGSLLLGIDLEADPPFAVERCGTCTRCLDACPTNALVEPGVLDANLCISYLTIEARGEIPVALRDQIGGLLYGCDICQDVCPWNIRFSSELDAESPLRARSVIGEKSARSLAVELLTMSQEEFSSSFSKSPMKRAKLRGLKRNAAVVLGNVGSSEDVAALTAALSDPEPLVREHAEWALSKLSRRSGAALT